MKAISSKITTKNTSSFGSPMVARVYTADTAVEYRFGFNGKENDNEVKGDGNQQDYGFRIFDGRLGRFLSVDPLTSNYPWYAPYQFSGNNPIKFIDLDGLEPANPPRTNIIIVVLTQTEITESYSKIPEGNIGSYRIFYTTDIVIAAAQVSNYLGDAMATNIVLDIYGNPLELVTSPNSGNNGRINANDIYRYRNNRKSMSNDEDDRFADVIALNEIISKVGDGGNFSVVGCEAGQDFYLGKELSILAENDINIYLNQDLTSPDISSKWVIIPERILPNGEKIGGATITSIELRYKTESENFDWGWVRYDTKGERTELKKEPGKTGNVEIRTGTSNGTPEEISTD